MKTRHRCWSSLYTGYLMALLGWMFLSTATSALAMDKSMTLQSKMADIALLNEQLMEKKAQAIEIREQLSNQTNMLQEEILQQKRQLKIGSFEAAQENPRIHYNLLLMQEVKGYIHEFNNKIRFYQIGCDKLNYLYCLAEDDLKIIATLSDLKIDALTTQIDKVIGTYLPEAHEILIDIDTVDHFAPREIWNEINGLHK
jgi:hypothetical protein